MNHNPGCCRNACGYGVPLHRTPVFRCRSFCAFHLQQAIFFKPGSVTQFSVVVRNFRDSWNTWCRNWWIFWATSSPRLDDRSVNLVESLVSARIHERTRFSKGWRMSPHRNVKKTKKLVGSSTCVGSRRLRSDAHRTQCWIPGHDDQGDPKNATLSAWMSTWLV